VKLDGRATLVTAATAVQGACGSEGSSGTGMPTVPVKTPPIVGTSTLSVRELNGAAIKSTGFSELSSTAILPRARKVYLQRSGELDRARVRRGLASARTPAGLALAANFETIKRPTTAPDVFSNDPGVRAIEPIGEGGA
jgi:hypothetical protein